MAIHFLNSEFRKLRSFLDITFKTMERDEIEAEIEPIHSLSIKQNSVEMEKMLIHKALQRTNGNKTKAAKILEISITALLYKIKEYGLSRKDSSKEVKESEE